MKIFRVVEVKDGLWTGDREMVEITDEMILAAYKKDNDDPDAVLNLAEWVIDE